MGQKTNPKAFRLVTTQSHLSHWYSDKYKYNVLTQEDYKLRQIIEEAYKNLLTISNIEITRATHLTDRKEQINICIYALHPRQSEASKKVINTFELSSNTNERKMFINLVTQPNLKELTLLNLKHKMLPILRKLQSEKNKIYNVNLVFIQNMFDNATLIAKYIVEQLEKRVPFRRIIKQVMKYAQFFSKRGLKIKISGRLNGIDIARSEWKREGKVPLHTLNVPIDYAHQEAKTIFGILGVKIWLYN